MGPNGFSESPAQRLRLPDYRLYGNGTLISVDQHEAPDPASGRVAVAATTLTEDEMQALLRRADQAGLVGDQNPDYGQLTVTDQGATDVRVTTDRGTAHARAYALGLEEQAGGISGSQNDARHRLRALLVAVETAVRRAVPEGYPAQRWLVLATQVTGIGPFDDGVEVTSRPWPLVDPADGHPADQGLIDRCVVVTSAELEPVMGSMEGGTLEDPPIWQAPSGSYRLLFRPVLPGEEGCAALGP